MITLRAGASGGALVSAHQELLGLVTSNARHSASQQLIPNLNFSIAATALAPVWDVLLAQQISSSSDISVALKALDVCHESLCQVWDLTGPQGENGQIPVRSRGSSRLTQLLDDKGLIQSRSSKL